MKFLMQFIILAYIFAGLAYCIMLETIKGTEMMVEKEAFGRKTGWVHNRESYDAFEWRNIYTGDHDAGWSVRFDTNGNRY